MTVLLSMAATAQIVEFEYDNAGNRILRDIIYLKTTIADSNYNKQTAEFQEMLGETLVTISPNPNGGKFTVKIEAYDFKIHPQIYLHSISGMLIYENSKAEMLTVIDISNYPNGTYILSLIIDTELIIGTERKTWKIIKQ